jgi:hemolysin type calcium-binding protein
VTKNCGNNPCVGTRGDDRLVGNDRKNHIYGRAGDDVIIGKANTDQLFGGPGDDKIRAKDGYADYINCGPGDDTAIVDRDLDTWVNCETVKPATPPPSPDSVTGTGRLGEEFGSPQLYVNARGDTGEFSITYPDGTKVQGKIACLSVNGNVARLVGKVESATGPRAENGTFKEGEYVRIGILDNGIDDKANFSASEPSFTSCTGETPNLEVVRGDFQVKDA